MTDMIATRIRSIIIDASSEAFGRRAVTRRIAFVLRRIRPVDFGKILIEKL